MNDRYRITCEMTGNLASRRKIFKNGSKITLRDNLSLGEARNALKSIIIGIHKKESAIRKTIINDMLGKQSNLFSAQWFNLPY